jgi:hypothetical protein
MKKYFFLILLLMPAHSWAQRPPKADEKIESLKIGFLTERLKLTPEEAKVFWPVYNQFQDELEKVRKQRREGLRNMPEEISGMSDKEIEKIVDNEIGYRQGELDVLKKYHPQFKQVLPIRKVARLYKAEEDFKRRLLELIKEKKTERRK